MWPETNFKIFTNTKSPLDWFVLISRLPIFMWVLIIFISNRFCNFLCIFFSVADTLACHLIFCNVFVICFHPWCRDRVHCLHLQRFVLPWMLKPRSEQDYLNLNYHGETRRYMLLRLQKCIAHQFSMFLFSVSVYFVVITSADIAACHLNFSCDVFPIFLHHPH